MTTTYTRAQLEQLALEAAKRSEAMAADKERVEEIKAILAAALDAGDTYDLAGVKVQVRVGAKRLDERAFTAAYPIAQHPDLYTAKPNLAAVKNTIAPADLEAVQTVGAPCVIIG